MTPRERRTFVVASLILLLASGVRYAHETRAREPLLPAESMGVGAALLEGTREARAEAERRSRPLAEGERLDPNRAPPAELDRLPGVGPAVADRVVAERTENGPFESAGDLDRVRGIGPATVERLAPYLDFSTPPPVTLERPRSRVRPPPSGPPMSPPVVSRTPDSHRRESRPVVQTPGQLRPPESSPSASRPPLVDLNRATAEELQTLRGVGPVMAERILELRRRKGPFRALDDLLEVRGIGPATLERLRPRVRAGP